MNPVDRSLQKLLNAASKAHPELPESPPFGFEAAVIARWRGANNENKSTWLLWLFQRATIFAIVVMTLSGAWNHYFGSPNSEDATSLASYAMRQLPP